jgi:SAM-dependent methyltransferase
MTGSGGEYNRQIQSQIAQYADIRDMHDGAPAAHWLNGRFLSARLREVFGTDNMTAILATAVSEAVQRCGLTEVVSLGSGYGVREIEIVKWVRDHGLAPVQMTCLELSPLLAERTREAAQAVGLEPCIRVEVADLNQPLPVNKPVAAFMAHHSLHHLVELELLFDQVTRWLHPEGVFVAVDMIGRNGHMRWSETLAVIRQIWPCLPDRLKWDHMFQKLDRWYENWDCSIEGFEGIRAQDILPQLIRKGFRFERFLATGGLTDVFYDRRFGRNFDLDNPLDVSFLEQIQAIEDRLLATGQIKPVCLYAVMRSQTCPTPPACIGGMTPEAAVRPVDPARPHSLPTMTATGFVSPYPISAPPILSVIDRDKPVSFARGGTGHSLLRWGWAEPEEDFTWSLGLDSALEFSVAQDIAAFELSFIPYQPPAHDQGSLSFVLDGVEQERIDLSTQRAGCHLLRLQKPLRAGSCALLELALSRPRRPDLDGGDDKRPLGIALVSMTAR